MKTGQRVTYCGHDGRQQTATVAAVVGAGASGYKRLDLALEGAVIARDVPYRLDAPTRECWLLAVEFEIWVPPEEPESKTSPALHRRKRRGE